MIIASAVKLSNGKVYIGKRHGDCYLQIKNFGLEKALCTDSIQGFITDDLEFLNREQGYYHAYKNKQCNKQEPFGANFCKWLQRPIEKWKACLFSEDLW